MRASKNAPFCSVECYNKFQTKKQAVVCKNCFRSFLKMLSQIEKYENHFCSKSCSATYNNKNKTHGNRRSKLEIYLENEIKIQYPNLKILCNDKTAINSELDFYFPDLNLAIELNGIFHYEPIYGLEKLSQIQNNDQQKYKLCHEKNIKLCILDSSKCKYLTQERKNEFYQIIKYIIDKYSTAQTEETRLERVLA